MTGWPSDAKDATTLSAPELALRAGTTVERIHDLTARGALTQVSPDRYAIGDVHRLRMTDSFEASGVTVETLVAATQAGRITFAYYDELHQPPGVPSTRDFATFRQSLGALARHLPMLYSALGLPEPAPTTHLTVDEEELVAGLLATLDATGRPELAVRAVRVFAEAARRGSEASLGMYADAVRSLHDELAETPPEIEYERVFVPWSQIARGAPALASWLTARHMTHAIDAYSVAATEQILEAGGFLPERSAVMPGVAFVDLTGFTRLSQEQGDEVAAGLAMRLGDVAREIANRHHGRVVKLLGDGVLLRFPDAPAAVEATVELMRAMPAAGLPTGHAGIHSGPLIEREGDVFGRSVNLAARVSDVAGDGEIYVTAAVRDALGDSSAGLEPLPRTPLPGIGEVELYRLVLS